MLGTPKQAPAQAPATTLLVTEGVVVKDFAVYAAVIVSLVLVLVGVGCSDGWSTTVGPVAMTIAPSTQVELVALVSLVRLRIKTEEIILFEHPVKAPLV